MSRSILAKAAIVVILSALIISVGILFLLGAYGPSAESTDLSNLDVACYHGGGAWENDVVVLSNMVEWMGCSFTTVTGQDIKDGCLEDYDVLMWPGGRYPEYWEAVGLEGKAEIQEFVSGGGAYLGICAGAYYAADYIVWMDDEDFPPPDYKVDGDELNLDLFSGVAHGPIFEIADRNNTYWAMTEINIVDQTHPITESMPNPMTMFYYGGPYLEPYADANVSILGQYDVTGTVAIVACKYGEGRVFLIGPHGEVEERSDRDGWEFPEDVTEPYDPESDWPLYRNTVRWLCEIDASNSSTTVVGSSSEIQVNAGRRAKPPSLWGLWGVGLNRVR
ncbi:MAG: BPL-N domain-containing protein [Candidatus Sifarchaeia archaeon]